MVKGILFDWVGVLVIPTSLEGVQSSNSPEMIVDSLEIYQPLWDILPALQERFALCCVNNGPKKTIPYFESKFGISRYMPFMNSEEEGVLKPYPEIYKRACSKINVDASEVIYLDDSGPELPPETLELGMNFIHWPNPETGFHEFEKALKASGF